MFRVSKYATNMSDRACSRWRTAIIAFFSIRRRSHSVIAVLQLQQTCGAADLRGNLHQKSRYAQYAYGCFLAIVGHDRQLHFTFLNIEHCVSRMPLSKNRLFRLKRHNFPALADGGKKYIGGKIALSLDTHKLAGSGMKFALKTRAYEELSQNREGRQ